MSSRPTPSPPPPVPIAACGSAWRPPASRFSEYQVQCPAPEYVGPPPTQVAEQFGVGAAGVLQGASASTASRAGSSVPTGRPGAPYGLRFTSPPSSPA